MEFIPLTAMGALVFTLINFLRSLTNKDFKSAMTQLIAWVAGVVVVLFVAQTDFASGVVIGDKALDVIDGFGLVFIGLMASSIFGVATSAIKAIDNTDSAKTPPLFPGKNP